jgi:predicted DCC family thiol-disulfide oxidoreductase YuxK
LPHHFRAKRVLDVGSLDINGNNRSLFSDCCYIGIDLGPGPNVDIVVKAHEFSAVDGWFDVVISTEAFEHDQYVALSLRNMVRVLKAGGLLLFTCAAPGRAEHGTASMIPDDSPFTSVLEGWSTYYRPLSEADIREMVDVDGEFARFEFVLNTDQKDLYFWGIKRLGSGRLTGGPVEPMQGHPGSQAPRTEEGQSADGMELQDSNKVPDTLPLILFDGSCGLCQAWVQWVIRHDSAGSLRVEPLRSATGSMLLGDRGFEGGSGDTMILVESAGVSTRSTAALGVFRYLGFPWRLVAGLAVVPRPVRDWVYDVVARNRHRWKGRDAACGLPDNREQDRLEKEGSF